MKVSNREVRGGDGSSLLGFIVNALITHCCPDV